MTSAAICAVATLALLASLGGCSLGRDDGTGSTSGHGSAGPPDGFSAPGAGGDFAPPRDLERRTVGGLDGFEVRGGLYGRPALTGRTMLLPYIERPGTGSERKVGVAAYDVRTGRLRWSTPTDCDLSAVNASGSVTAGVSVWSCDSDQGGGSDGDDDGGVVGIDVATGKVRWRSDVSIEPLADEVALDDGLVLLAPIGEEAEVLDAASGHVRTRFATKDGGVALGRGVIVVGRSNQVQGISPDGEVRWSQPVDGHQVLVDTDGSIVAIARDGTSHRITADGARAEAGPMIDTSRYPVGLVDHHVLTWSPGDGTLESRDLAAAGRVAWTRPGDSDAPPDKLGPYVQTVTEEVAQLRRIDAGKVEATTPGFFNVVQGRRALVSIPVPGRALVAVIDLD